MRGAITVGGAPCTDAVVSLTVVHSWGEERVHVEVGAGGFYTAAAVPPGSALLRVQCYGADGQVRESESTLHISPGMEYREDVAFAGR